MRLWRMEIDQFQRQIHAVASHPPHSRVAYPCVAGKTSSISHPVRRVIISLSGDNCGLNNVDRQGPIFPAILSGPLPTGLKPLSLVAIAVLAVGGSMPDEPNASGASHPKPIPVVLNHNAMNAACAENSVSTVDALGLRLGSLSLGEAPAPPPSPRPADSGGNATQQHRARLGHCHCIGFQIKTKTCSRNIIICSDSPGAGTKGGSIDIAISRWDQPAIGT